MSTHHSASYDAPVDEQRRMLAGCLDGLTEVEAELKLVPSKTTLLGSSFRTVR